MTMPITSFVSGTVVSSTWLNEVNNRIGEVYTPLSYGAVGDGTADDTTPLVNCFAAAPAYSTIDLMGKTYSVTHGVRPAIGVVVRNGRVKLNNAVDQFCYGLIANDKCTFMNIHFLGAGLTGTGVTPKYQGGVFGGNTSYPSPYNVTPANDVTVFNCRFQDLTVGVWSGGATGDPVPVGWKVEANTFENIVGLAGLSEGYGVLFTPSNKGTIVGNIFKTVKRHAIYLASEASHNVVGYNIIDGVDNIAIQSNTSVTQNYADGNIIIGNNIKGLTRSIAYGYRSSIGIGCYGKFQNYLISNNRVYGALDTGIDLSGELSGSAYATTTVTTDNFIQMDATSTDAGIRCDGVLAGRISDNYIRLAGGIYGVVITSTVTAATTLMSVTNNTIETTNTSAVAFRLALAAARTVRLFDNNVRGFLSAYLSNLTDTSAAGIVRTDLNQRVGLFSSDAGFTHNSGGTVDQTDCKYIRHSGTLTAARTITLSETNVDPGNEVTIMRTGSGAFNLNVNTASGATLKALTTNQWVRCVLNQSNQWEVAGFGSM